MMLGRKKKERRRSRRIARKMKRRRGKERSQIVDVVADARSSATEADDVFFAPPKQFSAGKVLVTVAVGVALLAALS